MTLRDRHPRLLESVVVEAPASRTCYIDATPRDCADDGPLSLGVRFHCSLIPEGGSQWHDTPSQSANLEITSCQRVGKTIRQRQLYYVGPLVW